MIETREHKLILKILQGTFIGLAMILPGLSAGTVILILGFYRQFSMTWPVYAFGHICP
jgi:uncharacterized membrane protein